MIELFKRSREAAPIAIDDSLPARRGEWTWGVPDGPVVLLLVLLDGSRPLGWGPVTPEFGFSGGRPGLLIPDTELTAVAAGHLNRFAIVGVDAQRRGAIWKYPDDCTASSKVWPGCTVTFGGTMLFPATGG